MLGHVPARPPGRPDDRPTVLLAIGDPLATRRAETACRLAGAEARPLGRVAPGDKLLHQADGLLWDALPADRVAATLRALRRAHPDLAIVLHPPAVPGIEALAATAAGIPRTGVYAQWDRCDGVEQLAELLTHHLATTPQRIVGVVLDILLEDAPARARTFAGAVLRARAAGRPCRVTDISPTLGVGAGRLRRSWPPPPFPRPKELRAAVTLLHAAYVRDWSGESWAAVATAMGVEPDTLRRLRKHWCPAADGAPPFDAVVLRCAERFAVPRERVRRVLEERAG